MTLRRHVSLIRALPHQSPRERLLQRTALLGDWCGTSAGSANPSLANPSLANPSLANPSLALRARIHTLHLWRAVSSKDQQLPD